MLQLQPSPLKHLLLLAISAGFVATAVLLWPRYPLLAWLLGLFFGLGMVVALITLIPGSSFLRLEAEQMTVRTLYRTWHLRRSEVECFFVAPVGGRLMVCWNYTAEHAAQQRQRAAARAICGVEAALPDTYGLPAAELAERLNRWRTGEHDAGTRPDRSCC